MEIDFSFSLRDRRRKKGVLHLVLGILMVLGAAVKVWKQYHEEHQSPIEKTHVEVTVEQRISGSHLGPACSQPEAVKP